MQNFIAFGAVSVSNAKSGWLSCFFFLQTHLNKKHTCKVECNVNSEQINVSLSSLFYSREQSQQKIGLAAAAVAHQF